MIAAATPAHADLVVAAAAAGKAVFCEKPMALTLADADRAIAAADDGRRPAAGRLQPALRGRLRRRPRGHRRRRDRHAAADALADPRSRPRRPRRGAAVDDLPAHPHPRLRRAALAQPGRRGRRGVRGRRRARRARLQGRRVCSTPRSSSIRFDNGAIATAEASFSAAYGYDVRAEVFGSRGHGHRGPDRRRRRCAAHRRAACRAPTLRGDVELFVDAYTGEFAEFADAVRERRDACGHRPRRAPRPGDRARLHRVGAVRRHGPCGRGQVTAVDDPRRLRRSGWPPAPRCCSATCRSSSGSRRSHDLGFQVEIWDWTTKDIDALVADGRGVLLDDGLHRGQPDRP